MAYATQADLEAAIPLDKLAQLTTGSGATTDANVVTLALANASAVIDGYLGGRYAIPVTGTTALAILKAHCIVLTKWALFGRNDIGEAFGNSLKSDNDDTIDWLMAVGKGTLSLPSGTPTPSVDVEISDTEATTGSETPVFTEPEESMLATEDL